MNKSYHINEPKYFKGDSVLFRHHRGKIFTGIIISVQIHFIQENEKHISRISYTINSGRKINWHIPEAWVKKKILRINFRDDE